MAFLLKNLGRVSVTDVDSIKVWTYKHATDSLATIIASGYFNSVIQNLTTGVGMFGVGDIIFIKAADTDGLYKVTAITTAVTVVAYDIAGIAPGSIVVSDLADNAVETAKIKDANVTTAKILDANVTVGKLATALQPSHVVKYAGKGTNGGGNATVALTVAGVLSTDVIFATVQASTNAAYVIKAVPTTDTITVTLSADPGASTVISYQALRAIA